MAIIIERCDRPCQELDLTPDFADQLIAALRRFFDQPRLPDPRFSREDN